MVIMHTHRFQHCLAVLLLAAVLAGCAVNTPAPSLTAVPTQPAPSATVTHTATATLTATPTASITPTPLPTATLTLTPTATLLPAVRIPIIEYHDPDFKLNEQVQMTVAWFEDQMKWLADHQYQTLDGDELSAYLDGTVTFPYKSVVLSFDIGTAKKQIYTDSVIPTLKKYKFKAVFFILANNTVVTDDCSKPKHFCWDDFRQWADEGVVTIASHGLFHPDFTKLTPTEIKYEVETARKLLQEKTGRVPVGFAFPFDNTSTTASTLTKNAGYQFAVAGNTRKDLAVIPNDPDRFKLPRVYPYSNARVYPNLSGFNRPFSDVIGELTRPGAVISAPVPTPVVTLILEDGNTAEKVLQFCRTLPTDSFLRQSTLLQSTFQSDVSAEARSGLPGLTTSISCNVLPKNKPEAIVVHYTVGELTASMFGFRQPNGTSSHYLIDRDGKVVQMVPENLAAMHVSCTNNRATCVASCPICDDAAGNLSEPYLRSIGIEMVNRGRVPARDSVSMVYEDYLRSFSYPYWEDYTQAQIDSLKVLVADIAARWKIPIDDTHVLGHYRINQKVDPGPALNLFWPRSGSPYRPAIFDTPTPTP
jgi:peptidoglycan/xylan/chitin deacetylase (PgdA/CDA1 family)/N-acetyl-anhydromuramyl-L-alanine amidase AmpD